MRLPLPAVAPRAQNGIRILIAAEAAVKAGKRADDVAFFKVAVMAQNGAAVTQVGADVEQVVRRFADVVFPKRHNLHQTARADAADRILAERAFHLNQPQHNLCIQTGPAAFILDIDQQPAPLLLIGDEPCQTCRHGGQPTFALFRIVKHQPRRIDAADGTPHHGSHIVGKRFFTLRAGLCQRAEQQRAGSTQQAAALQVGG